MVQYENMLIKYIEWRNFEVRAAAHWCARKGYGGGFGDPLPDLISTRAATWIEGNVRAFRGMVREEKEKLEQEQAEFLARKIAELDWLK